MPRRLPNASNRTYETQLEFDLLVSQRNQLFRLVVENGFVADDFTWLASDGAFLGVEDLVVPMLEHHGTRFWCRFGFREESDYRRSPYNNQQSFYGEFFLQRAPAETKARDIIAWAPWSDILAGFREWLSFIKRESADPDYWVIAPPAGIIPATNSDAPNDPFTQEERSRIEQSLSDALAEVHRVAELSRDQSAALHDTVNYMKESANRLGRKDWLNGVIGAYFGWAVSTSLNSQAAQNVFDFITGRLSWLWNELPKLLK